MYASSRRTPPTLGQEPGAATITGRAKYYAGEVTERWITQPRISCEACERARQRDPEGYRCEPAGSAVSATGEPVLMCTPKTRQTRLDLRPGVMGAPGDEGWALLVPDLVPSGGGYLDAIVRLQGDVPALQEGQTYTLTGQWVGTPPNNLCVGCGWDFRVTGTADASDGAPTGVLAPEDEEEYVRARIEAGGLQTEQEAIEAGATPEEAARLRDAEEAARWEQYETGIYTPPEADGTTGGVQLPGLDLQSPWVWVGAAAFLLLLRRS